MLIHNDRISRQREEIEQLKQRDRDRVARERQRQRKLNDRRIYVIGKAIVKHFPDAMPFTLQQSRAERDILVASFDRSLAQLSGDQDLLQRLKQNWTQSLMMGTQKE